METPPPGNPLRILVVEANAGTLQRIRRLLEELGHSVLTAATIDDAISLLSGTQCGALLCDMCLPDGFGTELLSRIPAALRPPRTVMMSIYHSVQARERSRAAGYGHYLVKPFSPAELAEALTGALLPAK